MRWLKVMLMASVGLLGWLAKTIVEAWTGRSFAQELAEEAAEQARVDAAAEAQAQAAAGREMAQADRAAALEARTEAEARHQETTLIAERQLAESRALREQLSHVARRRDDIARQSRSHDVEIRSSSWLDSEEPEPESDAPMPACA